MGKLPPPTTRKAGKRITHSGNRRNALPGAGRCGDSPEGHCSVTPEVAEALTWIRPCRRRVTGYKRWPSPRPSPPTNARPPATPSHVPAAHAPPRCAVRAWEAVQPGPQDELPAAHAPPRCAARGGYHSNEYAK